MWWPVRLFVSYICKIQCGFVPCLLFALFSLVCPLALVLKYCVACILVKFDLYRYFLIVTLGSAQVRLLTRKFASYFLPSSTQSNTAWRQVHGHQDMVPKVD